MAHFECSQSVVKSLKSVLDYVSEDERGVPGGVVVKFKAHASDKLAFLNGAKGTVLAVKRSRAVVTWDTPAPTDGYTGEWNWTIENLLPADEVDRQGYTIPLGNVS